MPPISIHPIAIITPRRRVPRSCWRPVGFERRPDHLLSVVTIVTHQLHHAPDLEGAPLHLYSRFPEEPGD